MTKKFSAVNCFHLRGGLGNQLFILSAALTASIKNGLPIKLISQLDVEHNQITKRNLSIDNLLNSSELEVLSCNKKTLMVNIAKWNLHDNPDSYLESILDSNGGMMYGYFQDTKIVDYSWNELSSRFLLTNSFAKMLTKNIHNRITIHFRAGDIRTNLISRYHHGKTKLNYYLKAALQLREISGVDEILLISEYLTKDLWQLKNDLISNNFKVQISINNDLLHDLEQIAVSKYVVCSNSSFSWWGAWLSQKNGGSNSTIPSPWLSKYSAYDTNLIMDTSIVVER